MKPELEGLLKFGMSKSHHITIRQQISFARQFEKQINDAILPFILEEEKDHHPWVILINAWLTLFGYINRKDSSELTQWATPSIYCYPPLWATLLLNLNRHFQWFSNAYSARKKRIYRLSGHLLTNDNHHKLKMSTFQKQVWLWHLRGKEKKNLYEHGSQTSNEKI